MLVPLPVFWGGDENESKNRAFSVPKFDLFSDKRTKTRKKKSNPWVNKFGPGGAIGVGCGAGIGVAVIGGAGVGVSPWGALKIVLGFGVGCGAGLGYGYGLGAGVRWDRPPRKTSSSKKVVIEL